MQFPAALTHPGLLGQHTALRKHTQIPLHRHPPVHKEVIFLPPLFQEVIAFFEADCTQVVVALLHGVEKILLEAIRSVRSASARASENRAMKPSRTRDDPETARVLS